MKRYIRANDTFSDEDLVLIKEATACIWCLSNMVDYAIDEGVDFTKVEGLDASKVNAVVSDTQDILNDLKVRFNIQL